MNEIRRIYVLYSIIVFYLLQVQLQYSSFRFYKSHFNMKVRYAYRATDVNFIMKTFSSFPVPKF